MRWSTLSCTSSDWDPILFGRKIANITVPKTKRKKALPNVTDSIIIEPHNFSK